MSRETVPGALLPSAFDVHCRATAVSERCSILGQGRNVLTLLSDLHGPEPVAVALFQLGDPAGLFDFVPASVWAALLFTIGIAALLARRHVAQDGGVEPTESVDETVDESSKRSTRTDSESSASETVSPAEGAPDGHSDRPEALDVARERVGAETYSEAVGISYDVVRSALSGRDDDTRTLWEFYDDVAGDLSEERADALEALTEAQERAQFAPTAPDESAAKAAIESAATCIEPAESPEEERPASTESSANE